MNNKYLHKVLDMQSVCLACMTSSCFRVIGDIIISSILFVCRTYKNIVCVRIAILIFTKKSARAENPLLNSGDSFSLLGNDSQSLSIHLNCRSASQT
jgi:hypothetical protein